MYMYDRGRKDYKNGRVEWTRRSIPDAELIAYWDTWVPEWTTRLVYAQCRTQEVHLNRPFLDDENSS